MAKTTAPSLVTITKLRLPEQIYDQLSERAAKFGRSVEEEIALRLRDCREHTATTPIYLNDDQRNELTQLAGRMIQTPDDLLKWARETVTLRVGDVFVPLSTQLLQRMSTRRFGVTWPEHVRRTVTEQLEQVVGLR